MYTQSIYVTDMPALDRADSNTYFVQHDMLQQLQKVAREYGIPGLVDACEMETREFEKLLTDRNFLSLLVEK
jgi:seryl-tRNA(Sec) selenium transferase